MIERFRQAAKLVVGGSSRERSPKPLSKGHISRHHRGMLGERVDRLQALAHVKGRNGRRQQQAQRKQQERNAPERFEQAIRAEGWNSDRKDALPASLLERDERDSDRFAVSDAADTKSW